MKLSELKNRVMFQTGNDEEDADDFFPFLTGYLNEGYDTLIFERYGKHVNDTGYPSLAQENDTPNVPEWLHPAIADYATWMIYRNGNPQKQSRGYQFKNAFDSALAKFLGGEKVTNFINTRW